MVLVFYVIMIYMNLVFLLNQTTVVSNVMPVEDFVYQMPSSIIALYEFLQKQPPGGVLSKRCS